MKLTALELGCRCDLALKHQLLQADATKPGFHFKLLVFKIWSGAAVHKLEVRGLQKARMPKPDAEV